MTNWSELPSDVLEHLTSFLPIQDYHRFGAVCRSWATVARQKRHSPAFQIPWLAMGEDKDSKKHSFYNFLENRHYYLDVPQLRGSVICSSSYGWLFTLDIKLNFHLVNPFTRECYNLPALVLVSPFNGVFDDDGEPYFESESSDEEVLEFVSEYADKCQHTNWVHKGILDYDPSKGSDFTSVILVGYDHTAIFWKPSTNAWKPIPGLPNNLEDITFFNGKFYTFRDPSVDDCYEIYSFEVGPDPKITRVKLRILLHGDPNYGLPNSYHSYAGSFIIGFGGELLLLESYWKKNYEEEHRIATGFVVHKLDLEGGNFSTCRNINGGAIFLGGSSTVVVNPNKFLKCRKDAMYFIDTESGDDSELYDLRIYDLVRNNYVACDPHVLHYRLRVPTWFVPNPW